MKRFPLFVAWRYLFSKKSTNAINLITGISVLGITVGMAALILELAVFNGFEELLSGLFNRFNPSLKVIPENGKFFEADTFLLNKISDVPGVVSVSETMEEIALFEYDENTVFATIKGVDANFTEVNALETSLINGDFITRDSNSVGAVVGATLRSRLGISLQNPFTSLKIFVPRKKKRTLLDRPFKTSFIKPTGIFSFQQDYDNQYIFTDLDFVRKLLELPGQVSFLELKVDEEYNVASVKRQVAEIVGEGFKIKDRYEQDEAFFKLMNLEKWMFYALFCLTLILIAFNMVGALWMLVLEKRKDISVLKSMGARDQTVFSIFINEGMLISVIGIVAGSILATGLYYYHTMYGLITIPDGFIVDRYPMVLKAKDFLVAGLTMLVIGFATSYMPASRAKKISSFVRTE